MGKKSGKFRSQNTLKSIRNPRNRVKFELPINDARKRREARLEDRNKIKTEHPILEDRSGYDYWKFNKKTKYSIHKTIDEDSKRIIRDYMDEWKKQGRAIKNPFVQLAKKLNNRYIAKSICHYYWNILDPRLDRSLFSPEEKDYIYKWASVQEAKEANNYMIPWRDLQPMMEAEFGKFRARNCLKNIWNSNKRRNSRLVKVRRHEVNVIEDEKEKHRIRYLLNDKNDDY
ncbi:uncharacterized protein OCT59_003559 [Rhizophagus irregularis]|uniref:Uncharacterized protein n=2 Tax=Rhizophagus irregularis TaxID=588596 RepID=A0A015JGM4_RHIIW|nr:hypothetical protein GLOIN_2v1781287 [Rhizophagus irregularis DAOM 181602=DAOM 197198]EXX54084.1 hypothetical protein RirG_237870 [Rhizophagus irregularis DAOM 197198w]UZO12008.1 hypothetical protein OCT59_003559 [Rhizophagus irregularis]POG65826.1 hypothetical protein GLOIN_2v1781287 [Rhizophagus irregularis DAOM 181602=DAOM 197198]CAG8698733.1 22402_t:CDS:2 [Rhizophagus irregularis]GBC37547.1 hypothetical protein GLOIN_2v1781287 [Rhizophagus irregularis DAOM 181602=DAOM 197198]|eukprot:XP_025172692.1 hypothetical protein GLOIN_2v1781287 [Rhizophagus irregularis DAOM 181602=DAOM 197198]